MNMHQFFLREPALRGVHAVPGVRGEGEGLMRQPALQDLLAELTAFDTRAVASWHSRGLHCFWARLVFFFQPNLRLLRALCGASKNM